MKRILFVDDEQRVLDGLRRLLRTERGEWEMAFASSGQEALAVLAQAPFDVIVSDMRMPGMDGATLLNEVRTRYPHIVRIVLSGQSDQETVLRSVSATHQYLAKPCNPEELRRIVARACALRDLLASEGLRRLVSRMQYVPSLPTLYRELLAELRSPDASVKRATEIISKDMGMTAKVLQLVNSAFFGLPRRVASVQQAVGFLGLDTVAALVLSESVFSQFKRAGGTPFTPDVLWQHGLMTGLCARAIAAAEGAALPVLEEAFTAGLLHDVGILVLFDNLPDRYAFVLDSTRDRQIALWEAERDALGATHAEVGAYLLGLWGLSDPIVEAVAFHHCPTQSPGQGFRSLTAVHAANVFDQEQSTNSVRERPVTIDMAYVTGLGLADRLSAWREACRATLAQKEGCE